jgi:hypothetical protein
MQDTAASVRCSITVIIIIIVMDLFLELINNKLWSFQLPILLEAISMRYLHKVRNIKA